MTDVVEQWKGLPRRLYLDTALLQDLWDYGALIWEEEPFVPVGRGGRRERLEADMIDLRRIMLVNERAMFEFVVSQASLAEVDSREDREKFEQWVLDVLDVWLAQSEGVIFDGSRADALPSHNTSAKDVLILQDALALDCDAVLTMDKRLAKQHVIVKRATGLSLLTPHDFWELLSPWAALYT